MTNYTLYPNKLTKEARKNLEMLLIDLGCYDDSRMLQKAFNAIYESRYPTDHLDGIQPTTKQTRLLDWLVLKSDHITIEMYNKFIDNAQRAFLS